MGMSRNHMVEDKDAKRHRMNDARTINAKIFKGVTFSFSCDGRPSGFYADIDFSCTVFHVCTPQGERIPILCPHKTLFDQRIGMCTDDDDVPCDQSEKWYYLDNSNYYSYFMLPKKYEEVILDEIDVYTVRPLEDH
ncbi:hypothetical protein EAI_11563 [Harpegnathos saltator]|uniref:Chitin-binding type-2 domain-containing protein n=2 Tax=Harpegnathos saltator TaxID=610380 RepID=E2C3L1_HARSA|nr:hypothetical protein EAI_11563 [Harpegnathos saltator]